MDLSPVVAYAVPIVGLLFSFWFGMRRAEEASITLSALGMAVVTGFILMFAQVALHGGCIEMKLCAYRGDGNMAYWFQSFVAIPLYWLVACITWRLH